MVTLQLDGQGKMALREALVSAFPDFNVLRRMVRDQLDLNLRELAHEGGNLLDQADDLINHMASRGRLFDLVAAASSANSDNPVLRAFVANFLTASTEGGPRPALRYGHRPFANRDTLRARLGALGGVNSAPVLLVDGEAQVGKSWCWWCIESAARTAGAEAFRVELEAEDYDAYWLYRALVNTTAYPPPQRPVQLSDLDGAGTPDAQARILANRFLGWAKREAGGPLWIVFDDHDKVWPITDEALHLFIGHLVGFAHNGKIDGFRVVFLGVAREGVDGSVLLDAQERRLDPLKPEQVMQWLRDALEHAGATPGAGVDAAAFRVLDGSTQELHVRLKEELKALGGTP